MPARPPLTEPQYFTEDSLVRRVHREQVVGLSGPRALLLMAAHPVVFEGFFGSTTAKSDPYLRLRRTAVVMDTIIFGARADADRMTRRVRAQHRKVRGKLTRAAGPFPAGTPYAADDPAHLLWILAALVDSSVLVYDRYVSGLSAAERDAYWADYRVVGRLFGLRDSEMPASWSEFEAYMQRELDSPEMVVTPTAREVGVQVVMRPPVPLKIRPLLELSNVITVGLLPARLRRQYGFSWDPAREIAVRTGAEYLKRVVLPLLPDRVRYVPSGRPAVQAA